MTDQHPITPPRELMAKWMTEARSQDYCSITEQVAARAAAWGADTELEACRIEIIDGEGLFHIDETSDRVCLADGLRAVRRPKPPSLKKQALKALDDVVKMSDYDPPEEICSDQADIIRRALEALPDD